LRAYGGAIGCLVGKKRATRLSVLSVDFEKEQQQKPLAALVVVFLCFLGCFCCFRKAGALAGQGFQRAMVV
jgi:hypothetical protein